MNHTPRLLYVAWQDPETRRILPIGRVVHDAQDRYEFAYIQGAEEALRLGFSPLPSFPDFQQVYRSEQALPLLHNRLLQPSRPDYGEHLNQLGLDASSAEPFTVLGRSGGRRATDKLEVFGPPTPTSDGRLSCHVFARGVRHLQGAEEAIALLRVGMPLEVVADQANPYNPRALGVRHGSDFLGYLPDYLATELKSDPDAIAAVVRKKNAPPASVHHRLLLEVTFPVTIPAPFLGDRYKPLSADATLIAA